MEESDRTFIYIEDNDFKKYQKFMETPYFKKNIEVFTIAVLIGKYVVKKPLPIKGKKKDYIRVGFNSNNPNMTILKAIAISSLNDVNALVDEEKIFDYCESYANSGFKQLYEWYNTSSSVFSTNLSKVLFEFLDNFDMEKLENL